MLVKFIHNAVGCEVAFAKKKNINEDSIFAVKILDKEVGGYSPRRKKANAFCAGANTKDRQSTIRLDSFYTENAL